MDDNGGANYANFSPPSSSSSSVLSFGSSMISPRSPPPGSVDLYGRRRQTARVQLLEREIALLQEELKSVEGVEPASICCKELEDYVMANVDPLIRPRGQEAACVSHHLWKRIRQKFCCKGPRICCFCGRSCLGCSGSPSSSCLCHGHRCSAGTKTHRSCYLFCLRTAPSCSICKCKNVRNCCCECKICSSPCCL